MPEGHHIQRLLESRPFVNDLFDSLWWLLPLNTWSIQIPRYTAESKAYSFHESYILFSIQDRRLEFHKIGWWSFVLFPTEAAGPSIYRLMIEYFKTCALLKAYELKLPDLIELSWILWRKLCSLLVVEMTVGIYWLINPSFPSIISQPLNIDFQLSTSFYFFSSVFTKICKWWRKYSGIGNVLIFLLSRYYKHVGFLWSHKVTSSSDIHIRKL